MFKLKEYNLRTLVVHVDGGWNSELAVNNIEVVINHCNYELHTHVLIRGNEKSASVYLKSVFQIKMFHKIMSFAVLCHEAIKRKCKTFMSGGNVATEYITPNSWRFAMDSINLYDIFKNSGSAVKRIYYDWFL